MKNKIKQNNHITFTIIAITMLTAMILTYVNTYELVTRHYKVSNSILCSDIKELFPEKNIDCDKIHLNHND